MGWGGRGGGEKANRWHFRTDSFVNLSKKEEKNFLCVFFLERLDFLLDFLHLSSSSWFLSLEKTDDDTLLFYAFSRTEPFVAGAA